MQALNSMACGHYALLFLKGGVRGKTMTDFVEGFSPIDFTGNDQVIGRQLRRQIVRVECRTLESMLYGA